jgi:hypothetical protein
VRTAAEALAGRTNVDVRRLRVPEEWPDGHFDLVVLSEVGYYLSSGDLHRLVERTAASLEPGGAVLACHWRHHVADYPTTGDAVHRVIDGHPALVTAVRHEEEDFLLDVWTRGAVPSVARREGLVG